MRPVFPVKLIIYSSVFLVLCTAFFTGCSNKKEYPADATDSEKKEEVVVTEKVNANISLFQENHDNTTDAVPVNSRCFDCHDEQYKKWSGSFHHHAMNTASPDNILADFTKQEIRNIAFDELSKLTEKEVALLLDEWLNKDSLSSSKFPKKQQTFSGIPASSPMVQLVQALSDSPVNITSLFINALNKENAALYQKELDFLKRCGPVRPDRVSDAKILLVKKAKELFDNGELQTALGKTIVLKKSGDSFIMNLEGRDGVLRDYKIKYVLGVFPLQQYLVEFDDGRIQCLPYAWNVVERQWFSLYPAEQIAADDPLHWTRPFQNWNHMCADCHTTGFEKNFDSDQNHFASRWKETGIGCTACHNGAEEHEKQARTALNKVDMKKRGQLPPESEPAARSRATKQLLIRSGLVSPPVSLTDNRTGPEQVESCAPCHSRRHNLSDSLKPNGKKYSDFHVPERVGSNVYYPDGQFRDECFEYGSFTQSRMYAMGVRCNNCHDSHSLELKKPGNTLCGQCHRPDYYDTPEHHHHETSSLMMSMNNDTSSYPVPVTKPYQQTRLSGPGMNCVDCHMPAMKFMVNDRRYDHNIHIPRPQLTLDLGTPNACNQCHYRSEKGEDAAWALSWVEKWYKPETSIKRGQLASGEHYAYAIAEGMKKTPTGLEQLTRVIRERDTAKVRDIVRAGAFDLLVKNYFSESEQRTDGEKVDIQALLRTGLSDPNDWVRRSAVSGFEFSDEQTQLATLSPLLADSSRAVRSETIRILASIDRSKLDKQTLDHFNIALDEYRQELSANADQGASWLNRGVLEQNLSLAQWKKDVAAFQALCQTAGESSIPANAARLELARREQNSAQKALDVFQKGTKLCPDFYPLRINLAMLCYQLGQISEAEQEFLEAIRIDPQQGETHYSLALLYAETNRMERAVVEFRKAAELLPERYRVLYNYALALDRTNQTRQAIDVLERALQLEPTSEECKRALEYLRQKVKD